MARLGILRLRGRWDALVVSQTKFIPSFVRFCYSSNLIVFVLCRFEDENADLMWEMKDGSFEVDPSRAATF